MPMPDSRLAASWVTAWTLIRDALSEGDGEPTLIVAV
jgi:hypothetical protein